MPLNILCSLLLCMETPAPFVGEGRGVHTYMCVCIYIDRSTHWSDKGKWSNNIQDEYCRKILGDFIHQINMTSFTLGFQMTKLQTADHYLMGLMLLLTWKQHLKWAVGKIVPVRWSEGCFILYCLFATYSEVLFLRRCINKEFFSVKSCNGRLSRKKTWQLLLLFSVLEMRICVLIFWKNNQVIIKNIPDRH